jgi:hypothetical protein
MAINRIDANVRCPSCGGQLYPRVLVCDACGLKVEADFILNEFGSLTPDELHFLRVFIYCEGRIRDMETVLGVSYPTVKGHLTSIRAKLNLSGPRFEGRKTQEGGPTAEPEVVAMNAGEILDGLDAGKIAYKDAVRLLKAIRKGAKRDE